MSKLIIFLYILNFILSLIFYILVYVRDADGWVERWVGMYKNE